MKKRAAEHPVWISVSLDGDEAQGTFSVDGGPETSFDGVVKCGAAPGAVFSVRVDGRALDYTASGAAGADGVERASLDFGRATGGGLREHGFFRTYRRDESIADSPFRRIAPETAAAVPPADVWRTGVPEPFWDGHDEVVACYRRAWEIVGTKIRAPEPGSGFRRAFVYTEFSSAVFIWGSCFITLFGRYAAGSFPFIRMLDNFYAHQEADGFIPRQLGVRDGRSQFERMDLSSTGGNLFAWAEWEWCRFTGDDSRLAAVYPVLLSYHRWLRLHRTWRDGTYFSSGWGCGMDNIPRMDAARYSPEFDHGHLAFVDVTLQQIFNARTLVKIAKAAGVSEGVAELEEEASALTELANSLMWDEDEGVYADLDRSGRRVACPHVGAFWALLAGVAPPERARRLAETLADPSRFAAPCGTASLSMRHPGFAADGGNYWQGGVWCMMDYMIASGLRECGLDAEAHALSRRAVEGVARVFADTGTIWESYSPTGFAPGKVWGALVRREFVGFSGIVPIAGLIEHTLGIRVRADGIDWDVRLTEAHGVRRLRFGGGAEAELFCAARASADEKPAVTFRCSRPVPLRVHWNGRSWTV